MATPKSYSHLTADERDRLALLRAAGKSLRESARVLRRSPSTLSRELRRNAAPLYQSYLPHRAQARAALRKRLSHRRARLKSKAIRAYVEANVRRRWSPELMAGRIRIDLPGARISHEAIYQWLYTDARHLIPYLRKRHRKRMRRGYVRGKHAQVHIPRRVPIARRPRAVTARRQAGHWEADTVGNRKSRAGLFVLHERKTRYTKLRKLSRKTARNVRHAATRILSRYPRALRRSITYDNGSENTEHLRINHHLGTRSYFCAPFHSWEKGSVENTIGLLRWHWPKSYNFARLSAAQVRSVERWLNQRPKKCLGFRTPQEAFAGLRS